MKQPIIFGVVMLLGMILGGHLAGHIFFGIILLGGLVALVENIPAIKWLVYKGNNIMDVILWILSALAIVTLGVSIAAALGVASLGYTMVYAPYVRINKTQSKSANIADRRKSLRNNING
jgi:Ca2+/Na+ antiporter